MRAQGAGGGAPIDATFITQTPSGTLTNEQALSLLATGLLKSTTVTGVVSIAAQGTDYYAPGGTDVAIADGGTGASTAQAAIDALTAVAAATNEHVLTKDTGTGNAIWKAAAGGSSLPVADTQTIVMGSADNTKLLRFEVDGFTAGATRVMTPPNANATLAGLEVVQNFTANQGFGITPTSQVEIQTSLNSKVALIVRAAAGALVDIIQVYDDAGALGFSFDRFANFSVFNGFRSKAATADTNYVIDTDSSVLPGNVQIQSRSNASIPMAIIPRDTSQTANMAALLIRRRDGTTPAAGYGSHIRFDGRSSTTDDQNMGRLTYEWATATHASRAARGKLTAYDTAEREAIRWEASGTAPMLGFYASAAVAQQTVTGSRGANAALADLLTKLATLGLIVDGTSA